MSATGAGTKTVVDGLDLLAAHRTMATIREFEELALRKANEGVLNGSLHLSVGMEAVPTGTFATLADGDWFVTTHRNHGHTIACGTPLVAMYCELFGREGGICGGKGGSMHMADLSHGHLGGTGIVGASIHLAAGAALTAQARGTGAVALAFFGDGAANRGQFHEGINMAALWRLPLVLVCENNGFGQWTRHEQASAVETVAERAAAYGIPGERVDGNDVEAVHAAVRSAVARARDGGGPTLLECVTYRLRDHHGGRDQRRYRDREEIARWRELDPITRSHRRLVALGVAEDDVASVERDAARAAQEACAEAETRPPVPAERALDDVG
jgi:acetoin:2,6-dichlorophenolindophenol oxidoreductase subunit alpha